MNLARKMVGSACCRRTIRPVISAPEVWQREILFSFSIILYSVVQVYIVLVSRSGVYISSHGGGGFESGFTITTRLKVGFRRSHAITNCSERIIIIALGGVFYRVPCVPHYVLFRRARFDSSMRKMLCHRLSQKKHLLLRNNKTAIKVENRCFSRGGSRSHSDVCEHFVSYTRHEWWRCEDSLNIA